MSSHQNMPKSAPSSKVVLRPRKENKIENRGGVLKMGENNVTVNSLNPPSSSFLQGTFLHAREVLKERKIFGTPGSALTWYVESGVVKSDIVAGFKGENLVGAVLNSMAESFPVYVFHSVGWPGRQGDTDHLVVCGNTVIVIDSKMWKSNRVYKVNSRGTVMRGTVRFPGGAVKMPETLREWRKVLPNTCNLLGVVCIAQKNIDVVKDENWKKAPFVLVPLKELRRTLTPIFRKEQTVTLGGEIVAYYALRNLIPPKYNYLG